MFSYLRLECITNLYSMYTLHCKCANAVYECMTNDSPSLGKAPQEYFLASTKSFQFWKSFFPLFLCFISYMDSNLKLNWSALCRLLFSVSRSSLPFLLINLWLPSNLNRCVLGFLFRTIIEKYLFFVSFLLSLHIPFLFVPPSLFPNTLFLFIDILSKRHKGVTEDWSL